MTPETIDAGTVRGWFQAAERITVLSGAGVSTASGIPDFRGPRGVWTLNPDAQRMFSLDEYVRDPALRVKAWINRRDHPAWTAQPNAAHRALVDLERSGRLRALLTQNIDGLHQRAGSDPAKVLELHGTLFGVECLTCNAQTTMEAALARVAAGEPDPACEICGGIQKAATISFGQALRADVLDAAVRAAADCDLFLAVGTSLQVQPAAGLCELAVSRGARLVVVNGEPTPYDGIASAVLREEISDVLPALLAG
ncbi:NAD-dependent protein deacetylase [Sporichthya brevicatena]|uniref:protein acetyllysine N-acetyltransferase n=1 Tax=Sporichthya brevicatena TaxID=171442 RepID=A0ABN1GZB5_9ACTN